MATPAQARRESQRLWEQVRQELNAAELPADPAAVRDLAAAARRWGRLQQEQPGRYRPRNEPGLVLRRTAQPLVNHGRPTWSWGHCEWGPNQRRPADTTMTDALARLAIALRLE